ncbi:MAG: AMP-binding protein [Actinomycetota bacterium]|nr:AMP-binding protein [Actinomycetota bacterium]
MSELVAIDLPGGSRFVEALQQVWREGDAAFPVDQRLAPAAREALLDDFAPGRVIHVDGETRRRGRPVSDGDAVVMATSGTTGLPKGVILTHGALAASAIATSARLGVDPDRHRWLACLPLNHVGGLSVVTRALHTGTPVDVVPGFDRAAVLALSGSDVLVSLVATTLRRAGAEHFHTVVLGGSAPPDALAPNVVSTYGLTETGSGVVYDGTALDGVEIDITPAGLIRLRGPMLLRSYRDGTVPFDADGWLATGDSGAIDESGRLVVYGRIDEMIITGGENVWPNAVEPILRRHPGVADVAVAGRPDPEWGQRVVAWVIPRTPSRPPDLDALRWLVADELAGFAAPRELVLVDELPRTSIGKIRRSLLR